MPSLRSSNYNNRARAEEVNVYYTSPTDGNDMNVHDNDVKVVNNNYVSSSFRVKNGRQLRPSSSVKNSVVGNGRNLGGNRLITSSKYNKNSATDEVLSTRSTIFIIIVFQSIITSRVVKIV